MLISLLKQDVKIVIESFTRVTEVIKLVLYLCVWVFAVFIKPTSLICVLVIFIVWTYKEMKYAHLSERHMIIPISLFKIRACIDIEYMCHHILCTQANV